LKKKQLIFTFWPFFFLFEEEEEEEEEVGEL
jgi:hypothetical protein